MDFWQVVRRRYSVRSFASEQPVSDEAVLGLLSAAIEAPSAGNRQPWHFYVVRDPALRAGLVRAAGGQDFIAEAPVAIVVCAHAERSARRYGERGATLYCLQDTAAAVEHILLAATALGLGTCWVGAFDEEQARAVLQVPPELRPVAIIPIGYPAKPGERSTGRRPVSDVTTFV
ncbi:MAG: nitroreductase family protein [Anaerolineae bacterium]